MKAAKFLAGTYMGLCYLFIFLPVGVLVLFSFQAGNLPVPPFHGRLCVGTWRRSTMAGWFPASPIRC